MVGPADTSAWKALQQHSEPFKKRNFRLSEFFNTHANRFESNSLCHESLLFDYSRNYLDKDTLALLTALAVEMKIPAAIAAMFRGEKINTTEQRAALHVALRHPASSNTHPEVGETLARMEKLVTDVHSGRWKGFSDKRITDVVNIGIGGSDMGPAMVCDALEDIADSNTRVHFVSNIDPSHLQNTLKYLKPETTLFIIASKSFSTIETLKNAESARQWLLQEAKSSRAIARHFIAITTNLQSATEFGIDEKNLLPLWDWVGGRFSLWSAIGLPIALRLGMAEFRQLLAGAHSMDEHFRTAELTENMPVVSALLSFWYREFFNAHSSAIVPYSQRLSLLPSFLQQLYMESLGKSVNIQGEPVDGSTGEILWGTAGTNGQHSYFQLLHQGTEFVPVEFIAVANNSVNGDPESHLYLLASCLSQSLALMEGKVDEGSIHKSIAGNKPSNTLLLEELNAYSLGMLLALYEHKTYTLGVLWNINAFDQWGVELGKKLSEQIFTAMTAPASDLELDASTKGMIQSIRDWNK